MSVIVKGMEMPENCAECKLKTWTNTDPYCTVIQSKLEWNKYSSGSWVGIDTRCPLRPMPEKHGRLIDGDELADGCDDPHWCRWLSEIEDMPTIVEAEGD